MAQVSDYNIRIPPEQGNIFGHVSSPIQPTHHVTTDDSDPRHSSYSDSATSIIEFKSSDVEAILSLQAAKASDNSKEAKSTLRRRLSAISTSSKKSRIVSKTNPHPMACAREYFENKLPALHVQASSSSISGLGSTAAHFLKWVGYRLLKNFEDRVYISHWLGRVREKIRELDCFKILMGNEEDMLDVMGGLLELLVKSHRSQTPSESGAAYPDTHVKEAALIVNAILHHCITVYWRHDIPHEWHDVLMLTVYELYWASDDEAECESTFFKLLQIMNQNRELASLHKDFVFNKLPFLLCDVLAVHYQKGIAMADIYAHFSPLRIFDTSLTPVLHVYDQDMEAHQHFEEAFNCLTRVHAHSYRSPNPHAPSLLQLLHCMHSLGYILNPTSEAGFGRVNEWLPADATSPQVPPVISSAVASARFRKPERHKPSPLSLTQSTPPWPTPESLCLASPALPTSSSTFGSPASHHRRPSMSGPSPSPRLDQSPSFGVSGRGSVGEGEDTIIAAWLPMKDTYAAANAMLTASPEVFMMDSFEEQAGDENGELAVEAAAAAPDNNINALGLDLRSGCSLPDAIESDAPQQDSCTSEYGEEGGTGSMSPRELLGDRFGQESHVEGDAARNSDANAYAEIDRASTTNCAPLASSQCDCSREIRDGIRDVVALLRLLVALKVLSCFVSLL